jgi:CubicO group peptidase (beta-lactamase class C family)
MSVAATAFFESCHSGEARRSNREVWMKTISGAFVTPKRAIGLVTCAVAVFATTVAWAQSLQPAKPEEVGLSSERLAKIGQVYKQDIDQGKIPGVVVMIARKGRLAYSESFGFQNRDKGTPMDKETIFRAYSMTKPLVSVAAMTLVEDGTIQLTDPVSKWLPEFKDLMVSVPRADALGQATYGLALAERQPTIQDLLRHTAGLAYGEISANRLVKEAYTRASLFKPDFDYNTTDLTPDEFTDRIAKSPLAHQPGTTWEYSLAVDVLGRVVEKVSGKRLGDFMNERLFKPLKMVDTAFFVPADKLSRLAEPLAKDPISGNPFRFLDVSQPPKNDSGGGGSVTTATDYLRFAQAMLNGGKLDDVRVLSRSTVALMTSDHLGDRIKPTVTPGVLLLGVDGYTFGLGFMVRSQPGIAAVPGSQGEFMWGGYGGTFFWVDPKENLAVVVMMQHGGPSRVYYRREIKQLVYQAIVD